MALGLPEIPSKFPVKLATSFLDMPTDAEDFGRQKTWVF